VQDTKTQRTTGTSTAVTGSVMTYIYLSALRNQRR